jgi:outer membrane immunogenic protein
MKSYLIGGIALLTLCAAPAMAADMSVKAMPAPAPVASWTGFYIGINGGGAWGSVDPSVRDIGPDSFFAGANVPAVTTNGSQSFNMSGGLAGGQLGYLFQAGRAVLGVEASFDWSSLKGTAANGPTVYPVTAPTTFSWNLRGSSDFMATFLGRIGFDMGQWYPYLTGGAAVARLKYTASYIDTFYPSISNNSFASTQVGWVVGGGAEWRVTQNWMLRGEYLHTEFDSFGGNGLIACTPGVGNCVGAGFSTTFAFNNKFKEDLGRILLSYRF